MKTLREEFSAHQNNMGSVEVQSTVGVSDEERNAHHYNTSFFGPCCTNGCQYCHPNCHEQSDSLNYF